MGFLAHLRRVMDYLDASRIAFRVFEMGKKGLVFISVYVKFDRSANLTVVNHILNESPQHGRFLYTTKNLKI